MKTPLAMEARMYWLCAKALRTFRRGDSSAETADDFADELEVLAQHTEHDQVRGRCAAMMAEFGPGLRTAAPAA